MRLRHLLVIGCVSATLVLAGPSQAVVGGEPDTAHPYVAALQIPLELPVTETTRFGLCSGAMISPTVMVTAAHCFPGSPWPVLVHFGPAVPSGVAIPGVAIRHSGFTPAPGGIGGALTNDLAVVLLQGPAPVASFASLPAAGQADTLGKKESVTVVGYGVGAFVGPMPVGERVRRAADMEVVDRNGLGAGSHLRLSPRGADACFGDSGGPALSGETILAVNSFSTNGRCQGSYAYRLDTPAAMSFLAQFTG